MTVPFIAAKWFTATDWRDVDLVVIHTAETPEGEETARGVANYFADPRDREGRPIKVSAHYCVDGGKSDGDEIVQCVLEKNVAYAAPGANHNGIQIELAGRAGQGAAGWADPYSQAMLRRAAVLVAELCKRHHIPVRRLGPEALRREDKGITGHVDVSLAFRRSTHTDPGPDFPWESFLDMVRSALSPTTIVVDKPQRVGVVVLNWVDSLEAPNGGTWHLAADGGIFTDDDGAGGPQAPFYGSVPGSGGLGDTKALKLLPFKGGYRVAVQHPQGAVTYFHYPA